MQISSIDVGCLGDRLLVSAPQIALTNWWCPTSSIGFVRLAVGRFVLAASTSIATYSDTSSTCVSEGFIGLASFADCWALQEAICLSGSLGDRVAVV